MSTASTTRRNHVVAALLFATGVAGCSATSVDGASGASGPATTASVKVARMAAGDGRIIIGHPAVPNLGCHALVVERVGPVPAGVKARFDISFGAFFATSRITEMDLPAATYAIVEMRCQGNNKAVTIKSSAQAPLLATFEVRAGEIADVGRLELYWFRAADINLGKPVMVVHQAGLETISGAASFMPASAAQAVKRPMVPAVTMPPDIDIKACQIERKALANAIVLIPQDPYPCVVAKRKGLTVGNG